MKEDEPQGATAAAPPAEAPPLRSYVRRRHGLVCLPAKLMSMHNLGVLDVTSNKIEVVPKGLLP
jgi:hypothetical protein